MNQEWNIKFTERIQKKWEGSYKNTEKAMDFSFFELWNPLKECLTIIKDSGIKPLKFFLKKSYSCTEGHCYIADAPGEFLLKIYSLDVVHITFSLFC